MVVGMSAHRLRKLKAMDWCELAHRVRYGVYTSLERRAHARRFFDRPDRLRRGLVPALRRDVAWRENLLAQAAKSRFLALDSESEGLRAVFRTLYRDELQRSREIAARIEHHEISFFGGTFRVAPNINWHADPVTGAEWPREYHRDVLAKKASAGCGDIKHVWELNRHQFLMDLAKVAFLDRSGEHAAAVEALLGSWLDAAPYGTGAPWACALEPAFRAWSWLWAYHLLRAGGLLSPAAHLRWLEGFLDHGRFLYRHLEYYASPFNHLVGEASALFALGLVFPEFSEASRWVRRGKRVLEDTVDSQFDEDGGTVEQSTFYHHATLGFYILSALLGRQHEAPLGPRVWTAIERAIDFSMALMQPDGRLPSIGGADDGKPIRLEHLRFWDFRPYYAIGSVLFGRKDFKAGAGRFWEDALWVLGEVALREFDALPSGHAAASRQLPHTGYSVFRTDWSDKADYVCFDHGFQAAGLRRDDVPSAAHGHADCLSVVANLAGQPVLVDPGFYCYNGDPNWEVHFRKTAAHNTVTIDGRDQARHVSKMAWTHTYVPHLEDSSLDDPVGWARGSHDGYLADARVVHRRTVWLRPGGYVVLCDELSGEDAARRACANYQFAPGALEFVAHDSALFDDRFELSWVCSVPVKASRVQDGKAPSGGWIAPSLGVRARAPRLTLEFPLTHGRVVLLVILADRARAGTDRVRRVNFPQTGAAGARTVTAWIGGAGWGDYVAATVAGEAVTAPGIQTDAPLALVRWRYRGVEEARRIGGTFLRVREEDVFDIVEGPAPALRQAKE
jgi:hypothetical protein